MSELEFQSQLGADVGNLALANRIGIYIRSYSTTGGFAAMQEQRLREIIDRMNRYSPLGAVVEVFKDEGLGFGDDPRPGIQALKRAICKKQITLVFVPEFRELATLPQDFLRLLRFFARHRCGLRSAHEYLLFEDLRLVALPRNKEAVHVAAAEST
jgi:hypothetical protein